MRGQRKLDCLAGRDNTAPAVIRARKHSKPGATPTFCISHVCQSTQAIHAASILIQRRFLRKLTAPPSMLGYCTRLLSASRSITHLNEENCECRPWAHDELRRDSMRPSGVGQSESNFGESE